MGNASGKPTFGELEAEAEKAVGEAIESYLMGDTKVVALPKMGIISLPTQISQAKYLIDLNLDGNLLTTLPTEIGALHDLRILSANNNQIASLPTSIGDLLALEVLRLSNNKLADLPEPVSHLHHLVELRLDGNAIAKLRPEITSLACLHGTDSEGKQRLRLEGNPLAVPPIEEAIKGFDAVNLYFANHRHAARRQSNLIGLSSPTPTSPSSVNPVVVASS